MFKLLKKSANTDVLIAEIHETFNTAGDKILASALEIINKGEAKQIEKAERLKKVGFRQSNEIKKWEHIKMTKDLAALIQYYQMNYPNNKFITEEQVSAICKKYNLSCGPVDRYKGFVPETKLKMVEDFSVKKQDRCEILCRNVKFSYIYSQEREIKEAKQQHPDGIFPISSYSSTPMINVAYISSFDLIENQNLVICAPTKDMDLVGLSKIGALFMSLTTVNVPDPVVLQPVKGGFLIVCAWGDEASDEIVVNQKMN